ncbi:hypothetical protein SMICM17S_02578 [Streptomyces microflavus]
MLTANLFCLLLASAQFGAFYFVSLYMQLVLGDGPTAAGFAFLPFCVGVVAGLDPRHPRGRRPRDPAADGGGRHARGARDGLVRGDRHGRGLLPHLDPRPVMRCSAPWASASASSRSARRPPPTWCPARPAWRPGCSTAPARSAVRWASRSWSPSPPRSRAVPRGSTACPRGTRPRSGSPPGSWRPPHWLRTPAAGGAVARRSGSGGCPLDGWRSRWRMPAPWVTWRASAGPARAAGSRRRRSVLGDRRGEGRARHIGGGEPLLRALGVTVDDRRRVQALDPLGGLDLLLEAAAELGVLAEVRPDHLDGDGPPAGRVREVRPYRAGAAARSAGNRPPSVDRSSSNGWKTPSRPCC